MQEKKTIILVLISFSLLIGANSFLGNPVSAEETLVTLIDEGFESDVPSSWTNTGWILDWYGFAHTGSHWVSNSGGGSYMTTTTLTFGDNTELSFWYAANGSSEPKNLEVYIDDYTNSSNLIWSDYGFTHTDYQQATVDLSSYSGDHNITFYYPIPSTFMPINLDDILLTTFIENNEDDDDSPPGGIPPESNLPPTADMSSGEPYNGNVGENINFDGSASSDSDGEVVSWEWNFGDQSTGSGETTTHMYTKAGDYNVTLTVEDDGGETDATIASIFIGQGNNPPSKPDVKVPSQPLEVNTTYTFHAISTDLDDDFIQYIFNWGDGTSNTTEYVENNTKTSVTHTWSSAGLYEVDMYAKDAPNAPSETTTFLVFVDVDAVFIDDDITGYLIDYHRNGVFTVFYNNETAEETSVETTDEDNYLIDADGDGDWEYTYGKKTGLKTFQQDSSKNDSNESEADTPGFALPLLLCALLIHFILGEQKKKR